MGEKGIQIMTRLINKIYKSGYIPEDFRESIFVPIPKVSKAQECGDFRTIALISHASKILLHLIKRRITPIIERQLGERKKERRFNVRFTVQGRCRGRPEYTERGQLRQPRR